MTIRNEPTLWCDGIEDDAAPAGIRHAEGRAHLGEVCPQWTQEGNDTAAIRRNARADGWVRNGGRDLSPQCAALARSVVETDV